MSTRQTRRLSLASTLHNGRDDKVSCRRYKVLVLLKSAVDISCILCVYWYRLVGTIRTFVHFSTFIVVIVNNNCGIHMTVMQFFELCFRLWTSY